MKIGQDLSILTYKGKKKINLIDEVRASEIYIEPFGGSFNSGFNLIKTGYTGKLILNDLDKDVISFWNEVKSGSIRLDSDKFWLLHRGDKGITQNILYKLIKNTEWIQRVEITNKPYQEVFDEYSKNKEVYMFIDPPYVKNSNYKCDIDHKELARLIKDLHCKWLLTYDDSDMVQNLYNEYIVQKVTRTLYGKDYTELFIRGNGVC